MKTIEERAREAGVVCQYKSDYRYDKRSVEFGYIQGAIEQKAIDDIKLFKLKSTWEKEAQINHNDENNYQQGFHDAIIKSCEWLKGHIYEYIAVGNTDFGKPYDIYLCDEELFDDFHKAMGE